MQPRSDSAPQPLSDSAHAAPPAMPLSNAEIAQRLTGMAQLLAAQGGNPYKIRAYRRAAQSISGLAASVDERVRAGDDLTDIPGIGKGLSGAIREIVLSGTLGQLDALRSQVPPDMAALTEYPRLDPRRVQRIYKKLEISSVAALREALESGAIGRAMGAATEQHVRQAMTESHGMLLYDADPLAASLQLFLREQPGVRRVEPAGEFRRRVPVVEELSFLVDTDDFAALVARLQRFAGRTPLVSRDDAHAVFQLPSGISLRVECAARPQWGLAWVRATGSAAHLRDLERPAGRLQRLAEGKERFADEAAVYRKLGLCFIPPELREGEGEVKLARGSRLPPLIAVDDLRGELHAHSTGSDGAHGIEEMAAAARRKGYEYLGITDHSQSLKIAHGLPAEALWQQIRFIDRLNERLSGIRILKSAEVDILADGSLDYPDDLLRELDYTICSIHSRFRLGRAEQTTRILRAMDHPCFTILGHATGRLLLKRPGYEIDLDRVIEHARENGRFFEINSSPDRLDLSAENARLVHAAGIKIAICTDAHSLQELEFIRCGVDQARRAGLTKDSILNCLGWSQLQRVFRR